MTEEMFKNNKYRQKSKSTKGEGRGNGLSFVYEIMKKT